MDGVEVNGFDRWKYRAILWVREKLYERPAGMLLKEGVMPPSIAAVNHLFAGRPVSLFLPYEAYTDDGLFKTFSGRDKHAFVVAYAFAIQMTTSQRLTDATAASLQAAVLGALPEGYVLQCITGRLPAADNNLAMLCVTAPAGALRADVLACRAAYVQVLVAHGLAAEVVDPDLLLAFVREAFEEGASPSPYDNADLIRNQAGTAGVAVTSDRVQLLREGKPFRDLALYTGRRFGLRSVTPVSRFFPALIGQVDHLASLCVMKRDDGFVGAFFLAELLAPDAPASVEQIFQRGGWLIEQCRYSAHLAFLALVPMAVNEGLAAILKSQRRWRPFSEEQVALLLPLPYQANALVPVVKRPAAVRLEETADA